MKKREAYSLTKKRLGAELRPTGYKWNREIEAFHRVVDGGAHTISVPMWDHHPQYRISFLAEIRLDEVEEACHEIEGTPPDLRSLTSTTITKFGWFTGQRDDGYKVKTPEETSSALDTFIGKHLPTFLAHLERYSDPRELAAAIDTSRHGIPFDSCRNPGHGMRAAWLAHHFAPDLFDAAIKRAEQQMSSYDSVVKKPFTDLLAQLRSSR